MVIARITAKPVKMLTYFRDLILHVNQILVIIAIIINDWKRISLCFIRVALKQRWTNVGTSQKVGNTLNLT